MSLLSPPLEAFWAVARKGTVQNASHILGITQTGVTQRIRSLEKQLQTTLFTRSRKGMKLTAEGLALLQYVKGSLEIEGVALSKIQRAAKDSIIDISISGPSSILRSRVIPDLIPLKSKFSQLRFHFNLSDSDDHIDKLKAGQSDFSIVDVNEVTREMDSKILKAERYYLYGPASWKRRLLPEIIKHEICIESSSANPMTINLLQKYKLHSSAAKERHTSSTIDSLIVMTTDGLGYTALAEDMASSFVKRGELTKLSKTHFYDFKLALAWYPRQIKPNYFHNIIELLN